MAVRTTRSILITLSDVRWDALIVRLSDSISGNAAGDDAARAFVAQVALEAVRSPQKSGNGHANGHART